ncbi:hypothetical protein PZE06_21430 [Robertmurraya sp. DFI.2.37]|uniref:hypothetical protein n=1 Tax=Robertmurraya sp. DFI.2.37 TaxID=3031819 RepID=UPI001246311E|nr:hypothetical protein [Robertmurraya sp. DFI.2.37]MDF1510701.1 hypothetical protein [Robertmurraya sp. DFI.2.37]
MVNINFSELSYDELVSHVDAAVTALRRRAYYEGYQQGKFDEQMDALMPTMAQEHRDEIIEMAKRDVVAIIERGQDANAYGDTSEGNETYHHNFYVVEFSVNREKRTVVALIRYQNGSRVIHRGIAKCAPTDCFNVHIGKAIALRRALGLEVPAEYTNAPQPTEVREGDVIDVLSYDTISVKTKSGRTGEIAVGFERNFIEKGYGRVIDDTRDGDAE